MDLKEKYISYRKRLVEIHMQILKEFVNGEDYLKAASILGILDKNNRVVIESTSENDAIYDFNIYGSVRNGSNAFSEYINKYPPSSKVDEELLIAMKKSDIGLYKIADHAQENEIIMLSDVMKESEPIKLIDIGMRENLNPNIFLVTRLINLDEFSMTSGLAFAFAIDHKDYVLKNSRKRMKKVTGFDESVAKFIAFFMLNRSNGLPVLLEKVK
ncbi:hypothetical protein [Desulfosporosinus lacus]|uniref:Uncharacterized protein n=1 Tax=Desulfosporosinus lacus DSM 15449 TaxID=1121420 RepID=A0A1M5Z5P3_9FIRM|nr:hypothetical protein [Desulfosporosinus lacus]SHI19213.1 hypothetical protein SAMN02746098_02925 [Desulfosporosinus lacus DSM 15449]